MNSRSTPLEYTIGQIHDAMEAGKLTAEELVARYLERIESFDRAGPALNSIITVNSDACARARVLDEQFSEEGFSGPLHGVPTLVKDQVETEGITTTFGSEACADYVPDTDGSIVSELKDAGAVVLAKTNMPDWAGSFFGYSSANGQTKNPYSLERDPGGSSGGTAASVAANLGVVGTGEDTGGSVRVPAANCNLFGLRPTTGLVSRTGHSPLVPRQDTPGPMARMVTDMTYLLDVLVGYDATDKWTGATARTDVESYTRFLNEDGLETARIGVVRDRFGDPSNPRAAPVTDVVESALETFSDAGATLVDPVTVSDIDQLVEDTSVIHESGTAEINEFLVAREAIPYDCLEEIHDAGAYDERLELIEALADAPENPQQSVAFWRKRVEQESFRRELVEVFAAENLDSLVFPTVRVVPPKTSELGDRYASSNFPTNTPIAAQTQCPAISVPAGFTDDGLPVGAELLGMPYSEHRLIEMAYAYEQAADPRRSPESAPALALE